jgi:predicted DNA-binding transcriptional regulator AlpA
MLWVTVIGVIDFRSNKMNEQNDHLINVKTLASMLATSVRSVWRYRSAGRLPKAVRVGSSVRWRVSDIKLWIKLGLPTQVEFEATKANGGQNAQS